MWRIGLGVLLCLAFGHGQTLAPFFGADLETKAPGQYLVVVEDLVRFKQELAKVVGATLLKEHSMGSWKSVLVEATPRALRSVRAIAGVKIVETNHVVYLEEKPERSKKKKPPTIKAKTD
jgi:hypothetical protein